MTKNEVKDVIMNYLKTYNITHTLYNDHEKPMGIDELDTIVISYPNVNAPGAGEQDIRLFSDRMIVRCYYGDTSDKSACSEKYLKELYKLFNFINNKVILDGYYDYRAYYDGYDHVISSIIRYNWFDEEPLLSLEFITCFMPEMISRLALPLFSVKEGKLNANTAIYYIKKELLNDNNVVIEWEGDD